MNASSDTGGLRRDLSTRQISMIAIGGSIGTGLFLGSGAALSTAGPGVVITYVLCAALALVVMWANVEMSVVHPTAGSFGAIAQAYLGGWSGFTTRWFYWLSQVIAAGGDILAASIYVRYWWPGVPLWLPASAFTVLVLALNAFAVNVFGEAEYWFSTIKVTAIAVFVGLGLLLMFVGLPGHPAAGTGNFGDLLPMGVTGVIAAASIVLFGFGGTEATTVMAAESRDPARDMPRAARRTLVRLSLFYVLSIVVIAALVPWNSAPGGGIESSPFVHVFDAIGIPAAASVMNFVVLTAALSSCNASLYMATRMMHSLARDGYAPASTGRTTATGIPRNALLLSLAGPVAAFVLAVVAENSAWRMLVAAATFGLIVVWIMILATHAVFRVKRERDGLPQSPARLWGAPVTSGLAVLALVGILLAGPMTATLPAGLACLAVMTAIYLFVRRRRPSGHREPATTRVAQSVDAQD
jgi:AAT family amino acid transporter